MISTKYPINSSLTSDDEGEIVAISNDVAGKKPFKKTYGNRTIRLTEFLTGALEFTETQKLLPDPDFEPEIKIEEISEAADNSKATKRRLSAVKKREALATDFKSNYHGLQLLA